MLQTDRENYSGGKANPKYLIRAPPSHNSLKIRIGYFCVLKGAGCRRLLTQQIITCKVDICLQPDVRNRFICTRDGSISYYGRQGSRRPEWRTISLKPKLHSRPCLSPPAATLASWSTVLYNMPIAYNKRTFL